MTKKKNSTTDKSPPWQVRNVPQEVRNAVRLAADRDAMDMGRWVSQKLMQCCQETLTGKREIAKPEDVMDVLNIMCKNMEEIAKDMNYNSAKLYDLENKLKKTTEKSSLLKRIFNRNMVMH